MQEKAAVLGQVADKAEPLPRQQTTKKKPQEAKLLRRKVVTRNVRTRHAVAWTRLIRDLFTTCGTNVLDTYDCRPLLRL